MTKTSPSYVSAARPLRRPASWSGVLLLSLLPSLSLPVATSQAEPPPAKPAAKPAEQPTAPKAAPKAATDAAKPAPAANQRCEVEFTGTVTGAGKLPPGSSTWVYAADGDCLAKDSHILGAMRASDQGSFAIEVFSRWGADLTLCAAVGQTPESPSVRYGKVSRKFHAAATGEIMFEKVQIPLKNGTEHSFPKVNSNY